MALRSVLLLPLLATAALAKCKPRTSTVTVTVTSSPASLAGNTPLPTTAALGVVAPESPDTTVDASILQQSSVPDVASSLSSSLSSSASSVSPVPQEQTEEAEEPITVSPSTTRVPEVPNSSTLSATRLASSAPAVTPVASSRDVPDKPTKVFCGAPNESEVLLNSPWIIFSMNYNYKSISGSACTGLYEVTGSDADQKIHWSSDFQIDPNVNRNVVKGYSFVGLWQGLETRLNAIKSIPSTFSWKIFEKSEWKGNVVYDFMTSDTKGDSTTSNAKEHMLWLYWHGGQVPIGWVEGPIATINGLFGKDGWKLYEGLNRDTGIMVSSLLAPEDDMFGDAAGGTFDGDIKDWLMALSKNGVIKDSTYVNVGNAGNEPYWGDVFFENTLGLRINF